MRNEHIVERLCEEIVFWHENIQRNKKQDPSIVTRMYEALELAKQRLGSYLANEIERPHFSTPQTLQQKLALKRMELGPEEFFKQVRTALPSTIKPLTDTNQILFGQYYHDDIFLSVQARYPQVTMADIRILAESLIEKE